MSMTDNEYNPLKNPSVMAALAILFLAVTGILAGWDYILGVVVGFVMTVAAGAYASYLDKDKKAVPSDKSDEAASLAVTYLKQIKDAENVSEPMSKKVAAIGLRKIENIS